MTSAARTQQALRGWEEHLITADEAVEIIGVDDERDLLSAAQIDGVAIHIESRSGRDANQE